MEKAKCTAKSKQSGVRCRRYPIQGGTVCSIHGGKNPRVVAAAQRRLEERQVMSDAHAVLALEGVESIVDPVEALAELAARLSATEKALAARVNALQALSYRSVMGTEQVKAEIVLWGQFLDRTSRILEVLGKFNLEDRRLVITERTAQAFMTALNQVLDRMELSQMQRELVPFVVPEVLRELEA